MRCPRCEFENMPGQQRCFRCGSALESEAAAESFDPNPPRASGLKRCMRAIPRFFRTVKFGPKLEIPIPESMRIMSADSLGAMILSIVPGLGHLSQGRFHTIWQYLVVYLVFLGIGLFLYGSPTGGVFMAFAVGMHAYIALECTFNKEIQEFSKRVASLMAVMVVLALGYWLVRMTVLREIVGAQCALTIPAHNIEPEDFLFGRRSLARGEHIQRGSVIITEIRGTPFGIGRALTWRPFSGGMAVQVIGLPGDTVTVKGGRFVVNGNELDAERYPLPGWLRGTNVSVTIRSGEYFISTAYEIRGNRDAMNEAILRRACVVPASRIIGKAVLRWMPLRRRGFLKDFE